MCRFCSSCSRGSSVSVVIGKPSPVIGVIERVRVAPAIGAIVRLDPRPCQAEPDDRVLDWAHDTMFTLDYPGMAVMEIEIARGDLMSATARVLIEALDAELSSRYPEAGATHFRLDPDEVTDDRGAFLIASRAGLPVACGAVRRIG